MVYEAVLVFALLAIAISVFMAVLKLAFGLAIPVVPSDAFQALILGIYCLYLFLVVGLYFVWFWTHGGQTLAMKTWRIRLVRQDGKPVDIRSASVRYMAAWGWFLPAFAVVAILGYVPAKNFRGVYIALGMNMFLWALAVYLSQNRQFLHDRLAGTRLVKLAS
jgi:uncharacterized RDD family membrane protein YckC